MFRICGPKCSVCCSVVSVWGIIMLVLMGLFLYTKSVAFADDLPLGKVADEEGGGLQGFYTAANRLYTQAAYNCWVAACLYIVTLAASLHQYYLNRRANYTI